MTSLAGDVSESYHGMKDGRYSSDLEGGRWTPCCVSEVR